jgi:hypothetical protein
VTRDTALAVRLADLRAQVDTAKRTVGRLSAIDAALYRRVSGRLEELVDTCEEALDEVGTTLNGNEGQAGWEQLRVAQKLAASLSRESLAFTEGALVRNERLDDGLCELADKLLDYFNEQGRLNWRGFTILAETAFYGEIGEVIRLKFPEVSIWHLPIAGHEFGHFANPNIRIEVRNGSYWGKKHPIEAFLEEEWKRDLKSWFYAHEYLADIFAVYVVGPAYPYCSILLRADPGTLRSEYPTHPSWDERYFLMIETLRKIISHGGATAQIVDDLERRWESSRSATGSVKKLDTPKLQRIFDRFYPLLNDHLRGARYTTFGRAQRLVPIFADENRSPPRLDDVTLPDVLNAAWLARLDHLDDGDRTEEIGRRAAEACRAL